MKPISLALLRKHCLQHISPYFLIIPWGFPHTRLSKSGNKNQIPNFQMHIYKSKLKWIFPMWQNRDIRPTQKTGSRKIVNLSKNNKKGSRISFDKHYKTIVKSHSSIQHLIMTGNHKSSLKCHQAAIHIQKRITASYFWHYFCLHKLSIFSATQQKVQLFFFLNWKRYNLSCIRIQKKLKNKTPITSS